MRRTLTALSIAAGLILTGCASNAETSPASHTDGPSQGHVEKDTTVKENLEKIPEKDRGPAPEDAPVEEATPADG